MLNSRQVQDTASFGIRPFIVASDMLCTSESTRGYKEDHLLLGKDSKWTFFFAKGLQFSRKKNVFSYSKTGIANRTKIRDPAAFWTQQVPSAPGSTVWAKSRSKITNFITSGFVRECSPQSSYAACRTQLYSTICKSTRNSKVSLHRPQKPYAARTEKNYVPCCMCKRRQKHCWTA